MHTYNIILIETATVLVILILMLSLNYSVTIHANIETSSLTSTHTSTFVTGKIYYHGDNISKGYYYGEGFKLVNNEWVLVEREGMVYLVFRPIKPSKSQNYIILLYCLPLKTFKEDHLTTSMIEITVDKFIRGLLRNDSKLIIGALSELERTFPLELRASIVVNDKEVGIYHRIAYSAREKMVVPIKIKAPLGRLSKEYVVIVEIIRSFSERELGGSRFYVYIRPPP